MKKLLFIILMLITVSANSTIYYVIKNSFPPYFKTIQSCVDILKPGDICYIYPGTYTEAVVVKNINSSTNSITISAIYPKTVTLTDFYISNSQCPITINNLIFKNKGIIVDSPNVQLIENTFILTKNTAITLQSSANNSNIIYNKIIQCQSGIEIKSDDCFIQHNNFNQIVDYNNLPINYSIKINGNSGVYSNNFISGSQINNISNSVIVGIMVENGWGNLIEKNIIKDYHVAMFCKPASIYRVGDLKIMNNQFIGNLQNNIISYSGLLAYNTIGLQIVNNLFANNKQNGIKTTFTFYTIIQNNILYYSKSYNTDNYYFSSNNLLFSDEQFDQTQFPHDIVNQDPLFLNINDFHLKPNSPAVDAGMFSLAEDDFDNNPRPLGNFWDIGPYEYTFDLIQEEIDNIKLLLNKNIDFTAEIRMINYKRTLSKQYFYKSLIYTSPIHKKEMYIKTRDNMISLQEKTDILINELNKIKSDYQNDIDILNRVINKQ